MRSGFVARGGHLLGPLTVTRGLGGLGLPLGMELGPTLTLESALTASATPAAPMAQPTPFGPVAKLLDAAPAASYAATPTPAATLAPVTPTAALMEVVPSAEVQQLIPLAVRSPPVKIILVRGDTLELDLQVFQPDGVTPFDLTGAKVWSTIKVALADPDSAALSQINSAGGSVPPGGVVTITDALNGKVTVRHAPAATLGLDAAVEEVVYDVQVRDGIGRVFTVSRGTITVDPDVTVTEAL